MTKKGLAAAAAGAVTRFTGLLFAISKAMTLLLMATVFADVFFRRLRLPLGGAMEITEAAFCLLCFFSFAHAWHRGDHIRVDIFVRRAPRGVRKLLSLASSAMGVVVFGCLAYSAIRLTWFSLSRGDTTANLHLPRALPQSAMVAGALAFCLQIVAQGRGGPRRADDAPREEDAL